MTRFLKVLTVWLLLGTVLFLAFNEIERRRDLPRFNFSDGVVEIHRAADGHYHWPGQINGHAVDFLVDTGATRSTMSRALAERLELKTGGRVRTTTANGIVQGAEAQVTVELRGGMSAHRLKMVVLPSLGEHPLLGMDMLGKLNLNQRNGVLRVSAGDGAP